VKVHPGIITVHLVQGGPKVLGAKLIAGMHDACLVGIVNMPYLVLICRRSKRLDAK